MRSKIILILLSIVWLVCSCTASDDVQWSRYGKSSADSHSTTYGLRKGMTKEERKKILANRYNLSGENLAYSANKANRYGLPYYDKDKEEEYLGKYIEKDSYSGLEKERITPYEVLTEYIAYEHDYLKIFEFYRKPKIKAFLIGNKDYPKESLRYPLEDVNLFKVFLQEVLGVSESRIKVAQNISSERFKNELVEFSKGLEQKDMVLIYYSGYGVLDGTPLFVDMKSINSQLFHSMLNSFSNDTVIIMDSAFYDDGQDELAPNVKQVVETTVPRDNIFRFYSNLLQKEYKEGKYKTHFVLRDILRKTYGLINQLKLNPKGNGLFTLLFLSFFADFSYFNPSYLEADYETVSSYINSIISIFEEEYGQTEGFVIARPNIYPLLNVEFLHSENDYILFRKESFKRSYKRDLVLQAIYNKALQLRNQRQFGLAANLFAELVSGGGDYKDAKSLLASCYLSLAELEKDSDKAIFLYKMALKYDSSSVDALYGLGMLYSEAGQIDKAQELLNRAKNLSGSETKEFNAQLDAALASLKAEDESPYGLLRKGYLAYKQNSLDKAMDYFIRAEAGFKKLGDTLYMATAINNQGSVYTNKEQYANALKFYQSSLDIKEGIRDYEGIGNTYNNLGVLYYKKQEYKKSVYFYNKALAMFSKLKIVDLNVAQTYIGLGRSYVAINNWEEAYIVQKQAVDILAIAKAPFLQKEQIKLKDIRNKIF